MPRPDVVNGTTRKLKTGCGNLYVTLNANENGELYEAFVRVGKAGGCAASWSEALGRLVTLELRMKTPAENLVKQLRGISCHQPAGLGAAKVLSCADAVGKALQLHSRKEGKKAAEAEAVEKDEKGTREDKSHEGNGDSTRGACPDCGGHVIFEEGCKKCHVCGWTEC
jgi:ribonucleoside-diphosphate reductase alpha chain